MILHDQSAVWAAPREALDATHRALTGVPFPAEVKDAAARVRITMLMLAAVDYAAPGEDPIEVVIQKGIKMKNAYPAGTLLQELANAIEDRSEPRAPNTEKTPRRKFDRVRCAAVPGKSRMQNGSDRKRCYDLIVAAGPEGITFEALEAALNAPARGHVQKLIDVSHVEPIYDEQQS